jgi:hypothetical protein
MGLFPDIMIDIETLDTKPTAGILSIGIVLFDVNNINKDLIEIEILIDTNDLQKYNFTSSQSTLEWWNKQPEQVRNRAFTDGNRVSILEGLTKLNNICEEYKPIRFWSQGINFDFVILENALNECKITPYWKFYQLRDSRTIQNILNYIPINKPAESHNAIEDCKYQISVVKYVYNKLLNDSTKLKNNNLEYKNNVNNWNCACNANNFWYRTTCFKCKTPKDININDIS